MKEYIIDQQKVIVDDEVELNPCDWRVRQIRNTFYVYRSLDGKFLHRLLIKAPDGSLVDHINRNGLDNREENLRLVSQSTNTINSEAYFKSKGVYQCTKTGKWYARIKDGPVRRSLGSFFSQYEAVEAYKKEQEKLILRARGGR